MRLNYSEITNSYGFQDKMCKYEVMRKKNYSGNGNSSVFQIMSSKYQFEVRFHQNIRYKL